MCWPSNESRLDNSDFGDTASVGDFQDQNLQVNYYHNDIQNSIINHKCIMCIKRSYVKYNK
jgi:hypothetical protein